ncbi:MAG: hypothetical protein AAF986_11675, partial [Pseudomonadota bacterium]
MRRSEAGYALMEVLIAAAITALVVVTSATSLRIALRGHDRLADVRHHQNELQNILAQAKAGVALKELQNTHPSYEVTLSAAAGLPQTRQGEARPVLLTIVHKENAELTIQAVLLRGGSGVSQ